MLRRSPRSRSPSPLQAPPPESLLSEIHAAMMSLLCDSNQHMSVEDPESIVVETRSGDTAEVVHWSARGFREVDVFQYYMNEKTIELTGFYLEKTTEMVATLRSALMSRRNPGRRRR